MDSNPLTKTFARPVDSFSILIANGDSQNQSYTLSDDLGDAVTRQLALPGAASGSTATLAPEPETWGLCAASLLFFLTYRKRQSNRSKL